jgi:hypothetical protein
MAGNASGYCIQYEAFDNPNNSMQRIFRPLHVVPAIAKPGKAIDGEGK